jgi:hypothetical protein
VEAAHTKEEEADASAAIDVLHVEAGAREASSLVGRKEAIDLEGESFDTA